MNDEYAETIVLGDGPLGVGQTPAYKTPVPKPMQPEVHDESNDAPSSGYPAFEDTSWLT